jgi:hypothetical protein
MIVSQQSAVLAHGLDYRPRPSFQEYSTYTPSLNEANRSFFASDRAPDWVIFGLSPIDNRHPALAEGASWPELLRRYKPESAAPGLVFLRRRSQAAPDVLGAPSGFTARLGVAFSLAPRQPSFVRLTLRPTLAGRLASAAYRSGQLTIVSTLEDGTVHMARLIAGSAATGFVVSPLVSNAEEFNDLASLQLDHARFVGSVRIEAERPWELYDDFAVEVRPLLIPN